MKPVRLAVAIAIILGSAAWLRAQTSPSLENGWKPFGSYEGSHLDTVNLMNGNLMFHAPIIPDIPGRGVLGMHYYLFGSSKDWQVVCTPVPTGLTYCHWVKGGSGVQIVIASGLSVHRTLSTIPIDTEGDTVTKALGYTIVDANGTSHPAHGVPGTEDGYGEATQFDSADLSGYHLAMSVSDPAFVQSVPVLTHFIVTDRAGNQYQGDFADDVGCGTIGPHTPPAPGVRVAWYDDTPTSAQNCSQTAFASVVTDSNGNQISLNSPQNTNPTVDTLGKNPPFLAAPSNYSTADSLGCVTSHPFFEAMYFSYIDPNGVTQTIKVCYAEISIQTAFGQANVVEAASNPTTTSHFYAPVTIILADGNKWTFDYDNYGELAFIGLPTGGSISYTWETIDFINCNPFNDARLSRAVKTRTLDDGQGHTSQWVYTWGIPSSTSVVNTSTDPFGNDTVHTFSELSPLAGLAARCRFYETSTSYYQGAQGANSLLQRVDTTFSGASVSIDSAGSAQAQLANVFATDVVTTVYPSGKAKKVHKDPDPGLGAGQPIFGNVIKELDYDWGQGQPGAPGALLRETDTTYKWELDPAYRAAGLLDLPASVIVKDAGGNRMAETDYFYDEPGYLTIPTPAVNTQHNPAPPNGVRGNQTTVSRWLNTTNSSVSSHTNWYDTGEVYQAIDPLGHTTTHSYDPAYAGAYATQTCSPVTSGVSHCVSGTYDLNSGLLTSLTNENATTQASGNKPGDSDHTSNYSYDSMFRITSAQAPPDPANNSLRAATSFNFSPANSFPVSVQRTKSITGALSDSTTNFFDGLGRVTNGQHVLPGGTANVDTVFDLAGHTWKVSNPYFSTSDPTYGTTTSLYDPLDRVYQTKKQDGSISSVAYNVQTTVAVNGDCVQTTDEAGKQRGACSDALGRLVEVDEPNSGNPVQVNYKATLLTDGNFVLENAVGTGVWSTGTYGTNASSIYMQDDGNLVLYVFKWQAGTYATPSPGPFPTQGCGVSSYLMVNQRLNGNQCIISPHGQYLLFMGTDGNFFIYDLAHNVGTWGAGTSGHPGAYAIMQGDGNLCVYDANNVYLWCSGTGGTNADRLNMEDDGRIIIYKSAWNSGTGGQFSGSAMAHPACDVGNSGLGQTGILGSGSCLVSPNGRFELLMQADGNMVIYDRSFTPNKALWSTGTAISTADPGFAMRTLYSYDALGNLLRVDQKGTAPNDSTQWRTRTFTYDSLSRLLTATNPESGTISYTYDNDGNLLQKTSPAPNQTGTATQTVSYCYDELHRLLAKGYSASPNPPQQCLTSSPWLPNPAAVYAYDSGTNAIGHLTSLTDQAGTASYTYDILGRLTAETRTLTGANNAAISKNLSYEYNLDGSLYKLHYPSGSVVTYEPGAGGLTLSAKDTENNINYISSATYGPDSALTGFVSGSGGPAAITSSFTYNKRLQPLSMSATAPGQTVFSIGYDFHAGNGTAGSGADNGNVFGITNYKDQTRNQMFTYDALNRLISAQNAGTDCTAKVLQNKTEYWGNSYGYDAWGNLLQKTITKCGAENLSVTADAHNWLHASGTDYQYDIAGNMTYDATASLSYTFDQENRLTGAAGYTYTYDGDGNRVVKSNGSTGTLYWYMTPGIVGESDLNGNLTDEYVFFDGERVARKSTNGVFYYFSDHLKTASVITDASGNIKSESDFYPWGGELQFVNNDSNHYKFTGKERDSETQLDYFGARYYSNGLGRWISADWSSTPIPVPYADFGDPQSLNQYAYVRNIPTTNVDVDGHDAWTMFKVLVSSVGAFVNGVSQMARDDLKNAMGSSLPPAQSPGLEVMRQRLQQCSCPTNQQQQDSKQNNNNSNQQSSTEQGRDAQGKFTSKQPGQSAPGSASEKEGLDSVGAIKNTEKLNGTVRDGTIPETGQHVEVKSGASINDTKQLRSMGQTAMDTTGQPLKVVTTNPNAKVSGPAKANPTLQIEPLKKE